MTPQEMDREIRTAQAIERRERDALLRQDRQIDNHGENRMDEVDRLNAVTPASVPGAQKSSGAMRGCKMHNNDQPPPLSPEQENSVLLKMMQESRRLGKLGTPLPDLVEALRQLKPVWIREALQGSCRTHK